MKYLKNTDTHFLLLNTFVLSWISDPWFFVQDNEVLANPVAQGDAKMLKVKV